jgi:hypothetical protein
MVNDFVPTVNSKVKLEEFERHTSSCYKIAMEGSILKMPNKGDVMKFKNHKNKLQRPFIVYADMEATLQKTNDDRQDIET